MSTADVKSVLLLSSSALNCSYSILFHCAKYWAEQGGRILFISNTPVEDLPLCAGAVDELPNPDAFRLIQFMYLASCQELLTQLYSIHLRRNPVSAIIVKNLENYFKNEPHLHGHEDHVSLVCASLLYAASTCARVLSQPVFLITEYICADLSIERVVIKNFFHNVWELRKKKSKDDVKDECEKSVVELSKLSVGGSEKLRNYTFQEDPSECRLSLDEVIKNICFK